MATVYKNIFEAVGNRNLTAVKHLIETEGIQPNIKNVDHDTLAHVAVRNVDIPMLNYLLEKDPRLIDAMGTRDTTLLEQAVAVNSMTMVKHLVENCNVEIEDAIHFAAQACHLPAVEYFIEKRNVSANYRDPIGQPVVFAAARTPCQNVVGYLIETWKVDVFMTDNRGRNIFCQSALRCDLLIPKYLLDRKKLPIDTKNDFILQDAFLFADKLTQDQVLTFIKYFVEEKHTPVNPSTMGDTPLHQASQAGMLDVVKYFVEHGADVRRENLAGKRATEVATKEDVKKYLSEKEEQQLRARRSLSVQPMWVRKVHSSRRSSPLLNTQSSDAELTLKSFTDVVSQQFCNFLILASAFLRSSFQWSDQRLSPQDIIESRMDPIAVDAVNNYFFRE